MAAAALNEISIRTTLEPGDMGFIVHQHAILNYQEHQYGLDFERYVAEGVAEFHRQYDPARDRLWMPEHGGRRIGSLLLMHRGEDVAQLRYFLLDPAYRGIGLAKQLMNLYMDFLQQAGYTSSYLWTTHLHETATLLYNRFGFALVEEHAITYPFGRPVNEQKYEWRAAGKRQARRTEN